MNKTITKFEVILREKKKEKYNPHTRTVVVETSGGGLEAQLLAKANFKGYHVIGILDPNAKNKAVDTDDVVYDVDGAICEPVTDSVNSSDITTEDNISE